MNTAAGAEAYAAMLDTANTTFPEYVAELQGIALGSGADFHTLFVLNVRNELKSFRNAAEGVGSGLPIRGMAPHGKGNKGGEGDEGHGVEHCSDYLMNNLNGLVVDKAGNTDGVRELVIAHNEDGGWESRDESALVTVHMEGEGVREQIRYTCKHSSARAIPFY